VTKIKGKATTISYRQCGEAITITAPPVAKVSRVGT
jgi:hypothetical protein